MKVCIEVRDDGTRTRDALNEGGFQFVEESFQFGEESVYEGFWGVRFLVDEPRGDGADDRLNLLNKIGASR